MDDLANAEFVHGGIQSSFEALSLSTGIASHETSVQRALARGVSGPIGNIDQPDFKYLHFFACLRGGEGAHAVPLGVLAVCSLAHDYLIDAVPYGTGCCLIHH